MVARIEETDLSVPVRKGPWLYYGRTVEGSSYGIHCRRPVGAGGRQPAGRRWWPRAEGASPRTRRSCLDENRLAEGHEYFAVGNLAVSPDHRWLAYSTDTTGGERYTMRFVDLATGQASPEALEDTSYGVAWANDNATVFYVRVDEAMRPYQLWRHRVGTDPTGDHLVYEEPDDRFYLGVGRTKDDRYVLHRAGLQGHLGVPGPRRRRPRGRVRGDRAPPPGHRVQRRPRPGRPRRRTGRPGSSS